MNKAIKEKWLAALRSGEHRQCQYSLRAVDDGQVGYCALGVLVKILNKNDRRWRRLSMDSIRKRTGLTTEQYQYVVDLNDHYDKPFPEIADYVEREL